MSQSPLQSIAIRVHGHVQGVFFRASTQQKAEALGLTGFVQNETNGTVYIEAEGGTAALQELIDWAHQGPKHARVEKVEVQELLGWQGFERFEQRR